LPLQLEITKLTMTAASYRDDESIVPLIHALQPRREILSLCISATSLWRVFMEAPPSKSWASLCSLTLFSHQVQPHALVTGYVDALQRIPTIRRLAIHTATHIQRWQGCDAILAQERLPELSLSLLAELRLPELSHLSLYPHLTKLYLDAPFGDELNLPDDRNCIPHLTFLSVSTMRVRVLEAFETPSLSELMVELNHHTRTPQHQSLENFLVQGCTDALKTVTLTGANKESLISDMVPTLGFRPSIARLNLGRWPYTSFVEVRQAMARVGTWLPNLTELEIGIGEDGSISGSEEEIERMRSLIQSLEKRSAGEAALAKLIFTLRPSSTDFPHWLFQSCKLLPKHLVLYRS
jgi:hypothetical protein